MNLEALDLPYPHEQTSSSKFTLKYLFEDVKSIPALVFTNYIPSLNGLRALSIIMVIAGHAINYYFHKKTNAQLGVQVFFVISGFLITTILLKEKVTTDTISLKRFYYKRFLRIFPVAYLFLLVVIVLNSVYSLNITSISLISSFLYAKNIIIPNTNDWYTGHFWSLSIEEQFYLLFPFLLKKSFRAYLIVVLVMIVILPISNYLYAHSSQTNLYWGIFGMLFGRGTMSILIGSLTAILLFKDLLPLSFIKSNLFLVGSLIVFALSYKFVDKIFSEFITSSIVALFIVNQLSTRKGFLYRFLNLKAVAYVGILSYSLYIWQQLFTAFQPWKGVSPVTDSMAFNLVLMCLVAYVSYNFYEKPFLRLKERLNK